MGFAGAGPFPAYTQVLDEMVEAGYKGTELGDWGYMPVEAEVLAPEIDRRGLAMVGALVPLALADLATHRDGVETALRTARLLAECGERRQTAGHLWCSPTRTDRTRCALGMRVVSARGRG